ncbi:hypothetical protein GMDG_08843 [Pseudogymnoascus destructans 20631-21]|uniref:Uncharacterized protein n=1 Tax=Pseudogymnoascus destructans (strain ATCC MYA-4855 / 20631-21) TaxID=658429 RepID=L8FSP1_PSED2|nr:hypothetical protein GMDG_08843 [Pseudogymnoascus destructans 20631-21]
MHKEARMGQRNGIGPTNYENDQSEPWSDEDDDEDSDSDEDDEETGIAPSSPDDKDRTEGGPGGAGGVLNFHLLGFTNQRSNRAHLAWEVVIRVRTLHAERAGASAKASCRIRNLTAGSDLPPKHGALILWSLGLRNDGAFKILSFVLDFRRTIWTDSART